MGYFRTILSVLLLGVGVISCTKEQPAPSIQEEGETHKLTLRFEVAGEQSTKANNSSAIPLTDIVHRLDLYMFFNNEPELNYHATIIPATEEDYVYEVEAKKNERVGVLVFANLDEDTAEFFEGTSLDDFYKEKTAAGTFVLEAGNFDYDRVPMIGANDYQFTSNGSESITLTRIMSRIDVEDIEVAFENENMLGKEVYVKNIAITNVMNTFTPLYSNSIGYFYSTYLYFGSNTTLSGAFGKVTKGYRYSRNNVSNYATTSVTIDGPGKLNGSFPYEYNTNFHPTKGVLNLDHDGPLAEMTIQHYDTDAGEGLIVPDGDMTATHTFNVGKCFYTLFWSAGWPGYVICDVGKDRNSTKLVIELAVGDKTYFYPIELAYLQPGYAYQVDKITIKNVGSDYSNYYVQKYKADFTVSIVPWSELEVNNINVGVDPETGEPVATS